MNMWIITLNGKPATVERLYEEIFGYKKPFIRKPTIYIAAATRSIACDRYKYYFGDDWKTRYPAVGVAKVEIKLGRK